VKRAACFDVPLWHETLWQETEETPARLAMQAVADERVAGFSDGFMPELFHRLYAETPAEIPANRRETAAAARARLHDLASELPDFEALRKRTIRDPMWAAMATDAIAGTVADRLPARADDTPPDADAALRLLDGLRSLSTSLGDPAELATDCAIAAGRARGVAFAVAEQAAALDPSALRVALRDGIAHAHRAIDETAEALASFGLGQGGNGARVAPGVAVELARRVRNSDKLRRIVELAGRLQATARAKRATRSEYARSELVGVEPTGDLARILPSELVSLADPLRTADLVRRLGERSAMGYSVRGREKTVKGPILVALDMSGSMQGEKDIWAKAIALAIADIARTERRAFGIVLFNSALAGCYLATDTRLTPILPLLELLELAPDGGTDFANPMTWALARIGDASARAAFKRADVVLVTDGHASSDAARATMARADALGAHVFGISIGAGRGALASWAHDVACIDDVSRDTAATDLLFEGI
jgi:Mg-chelatase subunit ChlD